VPIGRVGVGAAVRPGVAHPDLGSADSLKRALLDADSLVYNRATTGLYFETVLKRLGIDAQVQPKVTRPLDGAAVMEHLLHGHGRELGFGATTEILLFKARGLELVGPLPAELQNYTTYVAAQSTASSRAEAAQALLRHLASPDSQVGFAAAGVEPAR
jgi:molybdate transport system substrate-binding protein